MHSSSRRPIRPSLVVAAVAAFAATGTMTSACSRNGDRYVDCVDTNGIVVDPAFCDDDHYHGGYWYYASSRRHRIGARAPGNWVSSRIDPSDTAARSRAGLPGSGKIGGTKISSGGFGGAKGGTKGGAKGGGS